MTKYQNNGKNEHSSNMSIHIKQYTSPAFIILVFINKRTVFLTYIIRVRNTT